MGNICEQTCNCCTEGYKPELKKKKSQQIKILPQKLKEHINVSRAKELKPIQVKHHKVHYIQKEVIEFVTEQQAGDGPHPKVAKLSIMPKLTNQQIFLLDKQLPVKQQGNIKGTPLRCFFLNHKRIWYQGQWKQGLPNGKGKAYIESGMYYQGYFEQGYAKSGDGIAVFLDGSYYRGEVSNSRLNGKGVYYNSDKKITYKGDWKDDKPDGFGKQQFANGNKYEGYFKDGYKNGKGIFTWANGMTYTGDFKLGYMWGHGILQKDHGFFQGQFQKGKKVGKSVKLNTQTGMYNGPLQNGLMKGNGVFIWNDKKKYTGSFQNGQLNGQGTLQYPNGQTVTGTWDKGMNIGVDRISSR